MITVFGLPMRAKRSAYVTFVVFWALAAVIGAALAQAGWLEAVLGGLLFAVLYWVGLFVHHYGHFDAGRRVGHPLRHIVFFLMLAGESYRGEDAAEIPARVHVRRALGGPLFSLLFCIPLVVGLLVIGPDWVWLLALLVNVFIYVLGSFVPLGAIGFETDGSTLLRVWRGR